jgi:hypothetical protein
MPVGEFLVFVLIVFSAVWGSVFLAHLLKRSSRTLDSGGDDPRLARLQEETEHLERRLAIVEDELSFFRELRAPDTPPGLPAPDGGDGTS